MSRRYGWVRAIHCGRDTSRSRRVPNGLPDIIEWPLWVVMQLGAALAIPVLALLSFVIWRRRRPAFDLMVAGSLAWVCAKVMKGLLQRGRPASFFDDVNLVARLAPTTSTGWGSPPATWPWPSPLLPWPTRT